MKELIDRITEASNIINKRLYQGNANHIVVSPVIAQVLNEHFEKLKKIENRKRIIEELFKEK